ncbi:Dynein heavy chain, cytoplasmic [Aphelenchoides fujianensis]|nr:Dynein heavy chain, cytoplasmic [Aphelenchoides fujianensis]
MAEEEEELYFLPNTFKVKFSNEVFKYNTLGGASDADRLLEEWTAEHQKKASILPRQPFINWHLDRSKSEEEIRKINAESLNEDTAFAKAWFWVVRQPTFSGHSQQTAPQIERASRYKFLRACVEEILNWYWSAEKLALVRFFGHDYPVDDERRAIRVQRCYNDATNGQPKRPTTAVSMSNLARFRIRRYFEEKEGVLFNNSWLAHGGTMTSAQIRTKIFALMSSFHRGIDEGLIPYLPLAGKKKRSTEITLSQECTKSAHASIKAYLGVLSTAKSGIKVECKAQERKLVLPVEKIKEDLKAPIVELARHDRIRLAADEVTGYLDECTRVVDRLLGGDEFQKHPVIVQFLSLIHNEPIPSNAMENYLVERLLSSRENLMKLSKCPNVIECGIFYVEMTKVWDVLQERARVAEVNTLTAEDIPKAVANLVDAYDRMHKLTQVIQFDPREHEYLINVALLRRALPRHVADHNMFFQRRLHIFAHFVRKRQAAIEANAQQALNRLKILNNFTNPDEVEDYLAEMRVLKPLILTIHQELIELNEQEKVVGLPQLSLHEVQLIGSQVNSLWSLFEWTQKFHDFRTQFFKRRRTEARVQECQSFLDSFIEILAELGVKLEGHRAAKAFAVQLKSEIEKFRHNIPVLEVLSCPRLSERHWQKMSDIVGFNLALYENATIAQICELNLNLYVSKLKPIAYIAEREGAISDQANFITEFWAEASFVMNPTHFWGIQVPANLFALVKSAQEHVAKIKAYRDPDNDKSFINQSLDSWISNLNTLLFLLTKWNTLLQRWKRISHVMRHSHAKMPEEFKHFRDCAKYSAGWPAFLQIVQRECFPLLRELYLNDEDHLFGVNVDGERAKFENHVSVATLKEDGPQAFVELLEKTVAEFIIKDYARFTEHHSTVKTSFRLTRVINDFILHSNQDSGFKHTYEEEELKIHLRGNQTEIKLLPDFVHSSTAAITVDANFSHNWGLGKVPLFYGSLNETRSRVQAMCRNLLCSVRFVNCHPSLQAQIFDAVIRAAQQNTVLFVLENVDQLPEDIYNHMCLCLDRLEIECARLILSTTVHSAAQRLSHHIKVFNSKSTFRPESGGGGAKGGELNVAAITGQKRRASSTKASPIPVKKLTTPPKTQKPAEDALMEAMFGVDAINYNLGNVNFSIACIGPSAKLVLSECIRRGNAKASWIYIDALTYTQVISATTEFGEASSGYLVKCLKEAMIPDERSPRQSAAATPVPSAPQTGRGSLTTAGTTNTEDSGSRRLSIVYKVPKYIIFYGSQQFLLHFPQISSLFYSVSAGVIPEMPPGSYITMSDGSNFYAAKHIRFVLCLPFATTEVTEWLKRYEIKTVSVDELVRPPIRQKWDDTRSKLELTVRRPEYLDVVDMTMEHIVFPALEDLNYSPFMDPENLFLQLEKDIEEAMGHVTTANYGEVLRATAVHTCVCFCLVYLMDEVALLDKLVEERATDWDRSASDLGKLPHPISQHRLQIWETATWSKWADDLKVKSLVKKEYSLSEIYVSFPEVDRVLSYVVRQFLVNEKHFILSGPNFSGKSAAIRRIVKQLEHLLPEYKFLWLDCTGRFDLLQMQEKLSFISVTNQRACLVIDHFQFDEACKALLELYNDQTLLVTHDEPQVSTSQLRLILIMETGELEKCWAYGQFRRGFQVIPMRSLSVGSLSYIFEQLIGWHLNTKTFSSEYLSLVPALAQATQAVFHLFAKNVDQLLPYIIRLAKGLMFAFPDNTPDLDSMKRLWTHEVLRTLFDRELGAEIRHQFLNDFDAVLQEHLRITVEKLFPSRSGTGEEDEEESFYAKKDESWAIPDFKLEKLLYSEMSGMETMDGITYGIVTRRNEFIKNLENLHFEYTKNHEGYQINVTITDFTSDHTQRVMRAVRQHNEHMALGGHPGCGRHQCVKLATFGVVGHVQHVFFDTNTAEAFEESWKQAIIDRVPNEWLIMLKQWLQRPVIGDLLSDTVVIKMAEKMVESEKALATLVQSSNIRLPGQRYCQFLSFEAFKNVDLLRTTLEARIADFLHAVFFVPPESLPRFDWCTGDYFAPISQAECRQMIEKVTNDCVAENKNRICDAVEQLFNATKETISRSQFNCLQFYRDSHLIYELVRYTVVLFNKRHDQLQQRIGLLNSAIDNTVRVRELSIIGANTTLFDLTRKQDDQELVMLFLKRMLEEANGELEGAGDKVEKLQKDCAGISDKLLQRNAKIGLVLEQPLGEFKKAAEKLTACAPVDYSKLGKLKNPSMGVKYTVEAAATIWKRGTRPPQLLSKASFADRVAKFDPNHTSNAQLKAIASILSGQSLQEQRLAVESPLAADLCRWVKTVAGVAKSNRLLKNHRSAAADLTKQLTARQEQLNTLRDRRQFLVRRVGFLEREVEQQDRAILKLNRMIFYRQRGDIVLNALSPLQNRWKTLIGATRNRLDNLLGNCIMQSGFRSLVAPLEAEAKTNGISKWRSSLLRFNINYDEKFTGIPILAVEYFRTVSWHEPWPLIQTNRTDFVNALRFFYNDCPTLDMSQLKWTDKEVVDRLLRSSYSDSSLIIFNVQSSPPAAWFEILQREPEKEKRTVDFLGRALLMGDNFKLVFVTECELAAFEPEFIRMTVPMRLHEPFEFKDTQLLDSVMPAEEDLLKMLTDFSAIDILESEDVTHSIIQLTETIPVNS